MNSICLQLFLLGAVTVHCLLLHGTSKASTLDVGSQLSTGTITPVGEFEAVGTLAGLGGCTATLIDQNRVLTAAHCVCPSDNSTVNCTTRATFTFTNVFPVDDPSTPNDESLVRTNVSIGGDVRVHSDFGMRGWLREDMALLDLDSPADSRVKSVAPIPVELPENIPHVGNTLTLIGYGRTGSGCADTNSDKRSLDLEVDHSNFAVIKFVEAGDHACPGDSGGPIINSNDKVVGVASWGDDRTESNYRPTSFSYSWIMGLDRSGWADCSWVEVGGVNSHNPGESWCTDGSFLVQFDQDQHPGASGHDNPIVGKAKCCKLEGFEQKQWGQCQWAPVGGIKSHNRDGAWCPAGSFLTQFDLDSVTGSDTDSPIVGQARCCTLSGTDQNRYGSTYWIEVDNSHQPSPSWAVEDEENVGWGFLTQFDLDGGPSGGDYPIVGQAKFSRPMIKFPSYSILSKWPLFLPAIIKPMPKEKE